MEFDVNDMVLVDSAQLKSDFLKERPSGKLSQLYSGPFKILKKISPVAYHIEIPPNSRVHPVIHISKLKEYQSSENFESRVLPPPPPPEIIDGAEEWEVEKILNSKSFKRLGKVYNHYLVQWKGHPKEDATWEPERNLTNSAEAIKEYLGQI